MTTQVPPETQTPPEAQAPTPAAGANNGQPPDDQASLRKALLRSMLIQRRFEERCAEAYALGKIGGFCHLYIGQEAISAGTMSMLRPDDYVVTSYRDHGQAIARGMSPRSVMAELFGRQGGCSGGKGGSMHLFDKSLNFLGGHGIVGGHIPLAAGVGWAIKYRGGDQVCVCFFGEAAVNIGAFHEALNMASLWKLPCVFLIENNRYGMGTEISRATANEDVVARAAAYRMIGESVDAQDVFAVRDTVGRAVHLARTQRQPTLLEMRTYRFMGHSMSDAASGTYRTKEELEENMKRDPIVLLHEKINAEGDLSEGDFAKIDEEAKAIAQDAWDFADASPEPPLNELWEDVLVDTTS
jgi:pyruvate dehydrogenase E1 component alpha subunit